MRLEHLSVPHLNGQENHHQSRKPNTASTEPKDTRAGVLKQLRSRIGGNNTRNSTQARQHATDAAAVCSVEEFRRGSIEYSVEVLDFLVSQCSQHSIELVFTVCMMYSSALRPT